MCRSTRRETILGAAEPLESRTLFAVSIDGAGWTHVTPEAGDRQIYVSASRGNDHNDGRSPDTPVESLDRAVSLLRNKTGDQLLLARGDVWHDTFGLWRLSGKSEQEPMVIGAFGDPSLARPELDTASQSGLITGSKSAPRIDHLAIIGIHFYADTRDPDSPTFHDTGGGVGLDIVSNTDDLLIEDCKVESYSNNIVLQDYEGPLSNVRIRRSIIVDSYSPGGGRSQGLYATGVNGLLLEDNVFDHNGWNERVPGAVANIFSHDAYLSGMNEAVVVRGNIFANASSHGLQARSGGDIENNLFIDNPIGLSYGLVNGATTHAGGVSGQVTNNVFLGDRDINGAPRGWAIEIGNTSIAGTTISHNVIAHDTQGVNHAIIVGVGDGGPNEKQGVGINALTISDNVVYDWAKGIRIDSALRPGKRGPLGLNGLTVKDNDFQDITTSRLLSHDAPFDSAAESWSGDRYDDAESRGTWISIQNHALTLEQWRANEPSGVAAKVSYVDPARTVSSYSASMGAEPNIAAFLSAAGDESESERRMSFSAAAVNDYIRAGFVEVGQAAAPTDSGNGGSAPAPDPVPAPSGSKVHLPPPVRVAKHPMVKKVRLRSTSLTVAFNADVGATFDGSDVDLRSQDGAPVDLTAATIIRKARGHTAKIDLTSQPGGRIPVGVYQVRIMAAGISAAPDGIPMITDFVARKPIRVR